MDKVYLRLNATRHNWWEAFKLSISIKGYKYYKPPPELKYRYPAPGSAPLDEVDHPNLYKNHWKTPYRDSHYNIQKKERPITDLENVEVYASSTPEFSPNDYYDELITREMLPDPRGVKPLNEGFAEQSIEDKRAELWRTFESTPKMLEVIRRDYAPWSLNLEDDYYQEQFWWRERGATGFESDSLMREVFVDLEYWIEEIIGKERITTKKMRMYKGTVKKWQVLDDKVFDREEVRKMQAAIRAPLPEELELYQIKHDKPMQLPITNANVSAWRDEPLVTDSADFDAKFIEFDRERRK